MLTGFFFTLRQAGVPVALNEWLQLMAALQAGVAETSVDAFHSLARTVLVKDERYYDRYDLAFGKYFQGVENLFAAIDPYAVAGGLADAPRGVDAVPGRARGD